MKSSHMNTMRIVLKKIEKENKRKTTDLDIHVNKIVVNY